MTWSFVLALVVIVVVAAAVLWRDRGWHSSSDLAFLELQLQRMPGDWPLLGAYSRYGWSHPGPAWYYLLWAPWRLLGSLSVGLLFGMFLVHMAAVIVAWVSARGRALGAAVLMTSALLVVWAVSPPDDALIPWNPQMAMLWAGTLVVVAWDASARGKLGAAVLLPVGTVLVQSHIGTALLVAGVCLIAIVLAVVPTGQERGIPWRAWSVGAVATVALWIPPLVEQFQSPQGNLGRILQTDTGPGLGLRQAVLTVVDAFALPPYWWMPDLKYLPTGLSIPWLLVLPAAALVVAVSRRDVVHLRFLAVAAVSALAMIGSVARASDPLNYLVAWIPVVAAIVVAGSVWILIESFGRERWATLAAPILLVVPAVGLAVNLVTNPAPLPMRQAQIDGIAEVARASGPDGIHLTWQTQDVQNAFEVVPGAAVVLAREAIPFSVHTDPRWPQRLRDLLTSEQHGREVMLRIRHVGDDPVPPGWVVVGEDDPFSAEELARLAELDRAASDAALSEQDRALNRLAYEDLRKGRIAWQLLVREPTS